jgi:hypothetical protein
LESATRARLATTLSPTELAQWSYDPLGFTQLPAQLPPRLTSPKGENFSPPPTVPSASCSSRRATDLRGYRECTAWLNAVKTRFTSMAARLDTRAGRRLSRKSPPACNTTSLSVLGTSLIIAVLFWLAHRRVKPMLWLLTLLALILAATLALGGLIFGTVSVISMGFAAILLGLAVDYAVVHYQEALAQPELSVPEIRRAIAPSIFWAAVTTISAFLVLNFGGLPGLAQLGSLVAIGVALAALVMIFAFLPPLFPDRMQPRSPSAKAESLPNSTRASKPRAREPLVFAGTALLLFDLRGDSKAWFAGHGRQHAGARTARQSGLRRAGCDQGKSRPKHEPLWLVAEGTE